MTFFDCIHVYAINGTSLSTPIRPGLWAAATATAVLMPTVGGTIIRSIFRLIGTVVGAFLGCIHIALITAPHFFDSMQIYRCCWRSPSSLLTLSLMVLGPHYYLLRAQWYLLGVVHMCNNTPG